jgi:putative toxin-antitoxin system antitoxin component (TIGR02293 family)
MPLANGKNAVHGSYVTLTALEKIYQAPGAEKVARLNAGVKAGVFAALADTISMPLGALAEALGLSARTLRNRKGRAALLTADETERSFRVYRVWRRAAEVIGNEEAAKDWMKTPQKALGRKTPLSLLTRDVGADEVLNLLTGIEYGGVM